MKQKTVNIRNNYPDELEIIDFISKDIRDSYHDSTTGMNKFKVQILITKINRPTFNKKRTQAKKLKDELWEVFSAWVKKRDVDIYFFHEGVAYPTNWRCITCNRRITKKSEVHAGHFIPQTNCGIELRYHPRNVHVQCAGCNMRDNHEGHKGEVYQKYKSALKLKYGADIVNELEAIKRDNQTTKWPAWKYEQEIKKYQ